jgi:hypothetical protein
MSEIIKLNKSIFTKGDFERIVDISFNQLSKSTPNTTFTLIDFFQLYENLFESIPKEGDIQSHRYILNKTAEYLGANINETTDIQVLLDEITSLRSELLGTNKTLLDLNKNNGR